MQRWQERYRDRCPSHIKADHTFLLVTSRDGTCAHPMNGYKFHKLLQYPSEQSPRKETSSVLEQDLLVEW